ncbi:acyl-CoA synthetase [Allopusillimonas soli]|uniref:Acyl-CoA synthetase n=1 Tax=Allopusillimonas soli TaxID=659016 RepID=A0A853FAG2_9BURK|nr:acyl-CoA synthetase [Allopusillimonas soli]NYT36592.1 acyl-CoA synthetase [Allopusillimonas soli]TEA75083.1 acyl-CoA synthetase [Allopusillimonas soli]
MPSIYDQDLPQTPANYTPLSPLSFIERSALVYPDRLAIVHGSGESAVRRSWSEVYARCRRLASALQAAGIRKGDTVAVMLPNTPPMVEAHFGIPMLGAVLNALNIRLDAEMIAFMLDHGEAKAIIVDIEFAPTVAKALSLRKNQTPIKVIDAADALYVGENQPVGDLDYEDFLAGGDPEFAWELPGNEWDAIALNYTSGTTGNPKGVVYHHRGAAAAAISAILEWDMPKHAVYLWTLPLFHCNGWCFAWAVAARAGVNVCLRRVEAQAIFDAMREHGVNHYCGAPIVHSLLVNAPEAMKGGIPTGVKAMVAGAAPPASMIEGMERMGFDLLHVYGLTETYGPATVCAKHDAWDALDIGGRARLNARQGVAYHLERGICVMNPETMEVLPADGESMGEIMFRGNITMKGYLKNPKATQEALAGGWFHSGDLAVMDPDGYVKIKDRSKDIIISGGENISSIEVEDALYRHPAVLAAAVVARPDNRWGETPCAFIELKEGAKVSVEDMVAHCKKHMAGYKVPKTIVFRELPKTATGKIQKFELRKQAEALDTATVA